MKHKEFIEHIKKHGITLAKTTEDFFDVPKGTKLWFGLSSEGNPSTHSNNTNNKNKEFDYNFNYKWYFTNDTIHGYKGEFILVDKFKVGDKVRIIKNRHGHNFDIGTLCTIKSSGYNPNWKVEDDTGDRWFVSDEEIEHIQESSPEPHYKQYLGNRYVVHCKTQEEWDMVLHTPCVKTPIHSGARWDKYRENSHILITGGYGDGEFYKRNGYTILSVAEFFGEDIEKDEISPESNTFNKPNNFNKINKIMTNAVNFIQEKKLKVSNPDLYELYKAGLANKNGDLTQEGGALMHELLEASVKEEMVATAKEINKEEKK